MKLRCNAGCWALVIRSETGNLGKVVRCVRLDDFDRWWEVNGQAVKLPAWVVEGNVLAHGPRGKTAPLIPDMDLMPLCRGTSPAVVGMERTQS